MDTQISKAQYANLLRRVQDAQDARAKACRSGSPQEKRAAGKALKVLEAQLQDARRAGVEQ